MLKIGSFLVNEELVQLVQYDPTVPVLSLFIAGQLNQFTSADIAEAWAVLNDETGFVIVGETNGNFLINSNLVEMAFLQGPPVGYVFRVGGHNYVFSDPGKFDFGPLTVSAPAVSAVPSGAAVDFETEVKANA
jgi:hypothetical protein